MIPVEKEKQVLEVGFGAFERQAFTINVSRESFSILISGLYQHKIRAIIRELATNAFDAHVEAGTEAIPFEIHLPSMLDATFAIRDYGISMSHEDTMHVYSSVFTSTKTNTNTQVGQLGLGSKSVFAKTDAFQVETFLDGFKRTYLCSIDTGGIPTITFVLAEETDEPNGVKVSFAAAYRDFQEFAMEAAQVALGFEVKPKIIGATIEVIEPSIEFENWQHYEQSLMMSQDRFMIKQGCVLYNIDCTQEQRSLVRSGTLVIDVPIGSVAVAANRESLSLDERTTEYINELFHEVSASIGRYVSESLSGCKTYVEAVRKAAASNSTFGAKGGSWHGRPIPMDGLIDLNDPLKDVLAFKRVERIGREIREIPSDVQKFRVHELPQLTLWVDRGQKLARRKMRLEAYASYRYGDPAYIVHDPTHKQLAALVKRWELQAHQIRSITTLPDVPVVRQQALNRSGVYVFRGELVKVGKADVEAADSDFLVIPIPSPKGGMIHLSKLGYTTAMRSIHGLHNMVKAVGLEQPVFYLTPMAFKQLDGADHLWEDAAYDTIMARKDELMIELAESELTSKFRGHIHDALVTAGELPAPTVKKYSPLLQMANVMRLFEADATVVRAVVEKKAQDIWTRYPLLPFVEFYSYRHDNSLEPAIVEYIERMNEKS